MKLQNKTKKIGIRAPNEHLSSQNKTTNSRKGLHATELLAEGSYGNLQTTHAIIKIIGYSLQTDDKASLLKTAPI